MAASPPSPFRSEVYDDWSQRVARRRERLQSLREQAKAKHASGAPAVAVAGLICQLTDQFIREMFESLLEQYESSIRDEIRANSAIVAVGGTGRGELAPFSDIDLLFLYSSRCPSVFPTIISQYVRDCWDAGMKLGHSVRTTSQAIQGAREDPHFGTSLVEARLLWGAERLFDNLAARFRQDVTHRRFARFYRDVVKSRNAERNQFGENEGQLEPDVKRSAGGLRDIQLIRWIGFAQFGTADFDYLKLEGALSQKEQIALVDAKEFITKIRIELHYSADKPQEVLTRDEQLRLADTNGFKATPGQRGVERFMQQYFRHASAIADVASRFTARYRPIPWYTKFWRYIVRHKSEKDFLVDSGEIHFNLKAKDRIAATLESQLAIFDQAAGNNVRLAPALVELVQDAAGKIPREVTPEAAHRFMAILGRTGQVGVQLREMYRTGTLEIILPEMSHVHCLLQFNQYHAYTVDEHSFRAVEAAERLIGDSGAIGMAYRSIKHRDIMHLAILLHDLGKGYAEDHSDIGRDIAAKVGERLGLSVQRTEMLKFLVHKHLIMANLAFRRDLNDFETLARFSREVGSPELLRMLLVMTAADMTAVGPGTWTKWKADLVTQLFEGAAEILTGGPARFRETERVHQAVEAVKQAAAKPGTLAVEIDSGELAALPLHYLTGTSPEQILKDLAVVRSMSAEGVVVQGAYEAATKTVEYRIYAHDAAGSGLFHKITGTLAAKGQQVLSASICTTQQAVVIDSFRVHDLDFTGEIPESRLHEIEQTIRGVILGQTSVEALFSRNRRFHDQVLNAVREPTRVVVDVDTSDRFTVIEVFASDRRGLLYTIASTLFEAGISISLAIIATHVDQVLDVFYVTDREGNKIAAEDQVEKIRSILDSRIEHFEQHGLAAEA